MKSYLNSSLILNIISCAVSQLKKGCGMNSFATLEFLAGLRKWWRRETRQTAPQLADQAGFAAPFRAVARHRRRRTPAQRSLEFDDICPTVSRESRNA